MANIFLEIGKGIEVGAEDLLRWVVIADKKSPAVLAALGIVFGGLEKALADIESGAANPLSALFNGPQDLADFKAVWPELKTFLTSIGVKL